MKILGTIIGIAIGFIAVVSIVYNVVAIVKTIIKKRKNKKGGN